MIIVFVNYKSKIKKFPEKFKELLLKNIKY